MGKGEGTDAPLAEEAELVAALRRGDEAAFLALVERHHGSMVRVAQCYVASKAVAEEVAQEAWVALLQRIDSFEGRGSLRSWLFRILTNSAKTRGVRDGRVLPFSSMEEEGEGEPAVDPDRFLRGHSRYDGHWSDPPRPFQDEALISAETARFIREAIETLPPAQRQVITLRDVEQWTSEEVCASLGLTEGNQRVLLHRARSKVRAALEKKLQEGGAR